MAMSRKDFELIAEALYREYVDGEEFKRALVLLISAQLISVLARANPRFDSGKFYHWVKEGKPKRKDRIIKLQPLQVGWF